MHYVQPCSNHPRPVVVKLNIHVVMYRLGCLMPLANPLLMVSHSHQTLPCLFLHQSPNQLVVDPNVKFVDDEAALPGDDSGDEMRDGEEVTGLINDTVVLEDQPGLHIKVYAQQQLDDIDINLLEIEFIE